LNRAFAASFVFSVFVAILFGSLVISSALAAPPPKVTMCHVDPDGDGPGPETIEVSIRSVPGHLGHGDVLGACLTCGNGLVEAGEECDEGVGNSDVTPNACRTTCQLASCGDGVDDTAEECDDGNNDNGDGCSATCEIEAVCGNGDLEFPEECDDSNNLTEECVYGEEFCTVCAFDCTEQDGATSFCGDNNADLANGEQCDGTDLNDMTCQTVPAGDFNLEVNLLGNGQGNVKGYLDGGGPGVLACKPGLCTFDTIGCFPD